MLYFWRKSKDAWKLISHIIITWYFMCINIKEWPWVSLIFFFILDWFEGGFRNGYFTHRQTHSVSQRKDQKKEGGTIDSKVFHHVHKFSFITPPLETSVVDCILFSFLLSRTTLILLTLNLFYFCLFSPLG